MTPCTNSTDSTWPTYQTTTPSLPLKCWNKTRVLAVPSYQIYDLVYNPHSPPGTISPLHLKANSPALPLFYRNTFCLHFATAIRSFVYMYILGLKAVHHVIVRRESKSVIKQASD